MAGKQSLLSVIMGLDSKKFESGLNRAQKRLKSVSSGLKKTGRAMSLGVTAPLLAIAASSFKVAADFELAMKKVKAISGATGSDFKLLEQSARELGASTVLSASEVASLQLEMAKLGLGAKEIKAATGDTLALAQAFGNDLGPTAEAVIKTLNQFGLGASDSGRVADVMATAFAGSALDLEKFSGAMANAGPVAKTFGFSMEETTALLGVLANNGIEGADAGTKLKMAFSKLAASGVDVKKTFSGIISGSLSYTDAMDLLGKRAAILSPIFGENLQGLSDLEDKFADSQGSAKRFAAEMDDTASGGLAAMRSAIEGAQISLGTSLAPTIMKVVKHVTDLAQKFSALSPETQNLIMVVGGLAAALGPVMMVMGALASPVGLIAAGIGVLAVGIAKVVIESNSFESKAQTLKGALTRLNKEVIEQSSEAKVLFSRLKDVNLAEGDRVKAINTLQSKYGDYIGNLDLNTASLDDIEAAERRVISAIGDRVRAQVLADAEAAKLAAQVNIGSELLQAEVELVSQGFDPAKVRKQIANFEERIQNVADGNAGSTQLAQIFRRTTQTGSKLQKALGDLFVSYGVDQFQPLIKDLGRSSKALKNLKAVIERIETDKPVITEVVEDGTEDAVDGVTDAVTGLGAATEDGDASVKTLLETSRTWADVSADLKKKLDDIDEKGKVFGDDFDKAGSKVSAITSAINELIDSDIEAPVGELKKLAEQIAALGVVDENDMTPMEKLKEQMQMLQAIQGLPFVSDLQTATQAVMNLEEAMRASALADPNFINTDQFAAMAEHLEELRLKMKGLEAAAKEVSEELDHGALLGDAMGQVVGAAFDSAAGSSESFGESVKKIFMNMIAGALSTAIANAIAAAFSPASPDNYATGGAAAPAKAAGLTAIISSLFASIPALHSGGMTMGPTLALIGDNPSGREAVIPMEKMGSFLGQAGANGNMNVTGKIQGSDIILSHERANRNRGR